MTTATSDDLGLDLTVPGEPPFRGHVEALLRAVAEHDGEALATLCDDSLGIVDAGPDLTPRAIRDQQEHAAWFGELFATLDAMGAQTGSDVTELRTEFLGEDAAHSDLRFTQHVTVGDQRAEVDAVATVVWKRMDDGRWVEARWHVSVLDARMPPGMAG